MTFLRMLALTAAWATFAVVLNAAEPVILTVAKADERYVRHSEGSVAELKDGRLLMAWIELSHRPEVGDHRAGVAIRPIASPAARRP